MFFPFYDVVTEFYCICLEAHIVMFLIVPFSLLAYHSLPFTPRYRLQRADS